MATNDVTIRLNAQDKASQSINQVKQSLTGLVSAQGIAGGVIGGLIGGGMMGMANAAIQAAAAIPQVTMELAKLGAENARVEQSFGMMASSVGQSSQAMLASMKSMTAGTVADTDLMLAANRAMMLGVSDNADEMGQLMAAAIERGRALGVSSQQAVNDIITGIGRMSPMILDNLGIVGVTQSVEEYAKSLGKTSEALTDVERKQALVNAVISSGSGQPVLDDAASSFERMDAAIKNMQSALGQLFSPAIAAIAQNLANATTELMNPQTDNSFVQSAQLGFVYLDLMGDGFGMVSDAAGEMGNGIMQGLGMAEPSINQLMDSITRMRSEMETVKDAKMSAVLRGDAEAVEQLAVTEFNLAVSLQQASAQLKEKATAAQEAAAADGEAARASSELLAANAALDPLLDRRNDRQIAAAQSAAILAQYTEAAAEADAVLASVSGSTTGAVDALKGRIMSAAGVTLSAAKAMLLLAQATGIAAGATAKFNFYRDRGYSDENAGVMVAAWVNAQVEGVDTVIAKFGDLGEQAGTQVKKGLSDAEKAFNDMRGRVQSMLSGALSPDGITIPEGPRSDDINENARRLAAIANEGLGDQSWMEEFKAEVPGIFEEIVSAADPKAAAAKIFTEFQAGLRPELIDKTLVKERIKAMITGEQEMSALATEIAQELAAEMGTSLPEALSAAQEALGVKPTGGSADQFGAGFEDGIDAQATAAGSLAKIAKAFLDNQSKIYESGMVVGAWFGGAFLTSAAQNISTGFLGILTNLLLPTIIELMAQRNSTTGTSDGN